MTYPVILTNLYYMLIHVDTRVNDKEVALGQQMMKTEGILETAFQAQIAALPSQHLPKVLSESVASLKKLDRDKQIRCIAWLCVIANSDGFMDRAEWQFIYAIYHKELQLPLDEIMRIQKDLNRREVSLPPSH